MDRELVVVSNRLPINIDQKGNDWRITPAAGGLVTALEPLVREIHGTWIG